MAGFHDAAGGAGDHEPTALGHFAAELNGLLIGGLVGAGAGRAKHRDFAARAVGGKNFEGVAQLAHRAAEDFEIAARRLIGGELIGRFFDLIDQVGNALAVERLKRAGAAVVALAAAASESAALATVPAALATAEAAAVTVGSANGAWPLAAEGPPGELPIGACLSAESDKFRLWLRPRHCDAGLVAG